MNDNTAFGTVSFEVFQANYSNGQTVALPVSPVDGYVYSRSELLYVWGIWSTVNPNTGWMSAKDSLWYGAWKVDQVTGLVSCLEYYNTSGANNHAVESNDGILVVWTIAQRGRGALTIASPPTYSDLSDGAFYQDAPYTETMARTLSHNSKFPVVAREVIYCGEFYNGQQVPVPTSPVDGHVYSYSDVKFVFSWRWTVNGSSFQTPPKTQQILFVNVGIEQLGPIHAAIDGTGNVTVSVDWSYNGGENIENLNTYGRIAVFAFCTRTSGLTLANESFTEITQDHFNPGNDLQASVVSRMNKNARAATCAVEFFGPVSYANGEIVPAPTSPIDGHVYSRAELFYVWEWENTTSGTTEGSHERTALFTAHVDPSNGKVAVEVWRLPPGGPLARQNGGDGSVHKSIRVLTIGVRAASNDTTSTHKDLTFVTVSPGVVGVNPVSATQRETLAFKIVGSAYFTPTPQSVAFNFTLESSHYNSDMGTTIYEAYLARVPSGGTTIIDKQQVYFGGSATAAIAAASSLACDPILVSVDSLHDYVLLVVFKGGVANGTANSLDPSYNKFETSLEQSFDTGSHASIAELTDLSDAVFLTGAFVFPVAQWWLISAASYDTITVAPPVDAVSSNNQDQDAEDTINGV
jgi:hypothetical protein